MTVTFEDYLIDFAHREHGAQRHGQVLFNLLSEQHPKLAERVLISGVDPFYDNARIPEFLAWCREHWSDPEEAERPEVS